MIQLKVSDLRTDGWTDGPTDGQTLLKSCEDASKNDINDDDDGDDGGDDDDDDDGDDDDNKTAGIMGQFYGKI